MSVYEEEFVRHEHGVGELLDGLERRRGWGAVVGLGIPDSLDSGGCVFGTNFETDGGRPAETVGGHAVPAVHGKVQNLTALDGVTFHGRSNRSTVCDPLAEETLFGRQHHRQCSGD